MDDESGALGDYLREIGKYPLLTEDAVRELAKQIEDGSEDAKRTLVEANLRLVVAIARKDTGGRFRLLDLIQEGNLGLIKAIERFDWRGNTRFSIYATYWIRQTIENALGGA